MKFIEHHSSGTPSLRWIERAGSGPMVLFLHGVCRCAEDFEPLWAHLPSHWRLLAVDQRGHGVSERADRYLVTHYVEDAIRLIPDEIGEPVVIYGHSLGAMVALAVAAESVEHARGIVLEDPPFHTMGHNITGTNWQSQFRAMREIARAGGSIEKMIDALSGIPLRQTDGSFKRLGEIRDRDSLRWSAACLSRLDPEVLTPVIEGRWLDGCEVDTNARTTAGSAPRTEERYPVRGADPTENAHVALKRIQCPVMLLQADPRAGGALMDEDVRWIQEQVHRCETIRFEGRGHLLHWIEPLRIAGIVSRFVDVVL